MKILQEMCYAQIISTLSFNLFSLILSNHPILPYFFCFHYFNFLQNHPKTPLFRPKKSLLYLKVF